MFKLFKAPLKETKENFIRENKKSSFFLNKKIGFKKIQD